MFKLAKKQFGQIFKLLRNTFLVYYALKNLLRLCLLVAFMRATNELNGLRSLSAPANKILASQRRIEHLYDLLEQNGDIYRNVDILGIMMYSLAFLITVCYCLYDYIPSPFNIVHLIEVFLDEKESKYSTDFFDQFRDSDKQRPVLFWSSIHDQTQSALDRIDVQIKQTLYSINNYLEVQTSRLCKIEPRWQTKSTQKCLSSAGSRFDFDFESSNKSRLLRASIEKESLRLQSEHLRELSRSKASIVPRGIGKEAKQMSGLSLIILVLAAISGAMWHLTAVFLAHRSAWDSLESSSSKPRFNAYARLGLAEDYLMAPILHEITFSSFIKIVIDCRSCLAQLRWLNRSFDTFFAHLSELRKLERLNISSVLDYPRAELELRRNKLIELRRTDCDLIATDIYINFSSFANGFRASLESGADLISKTCNVFMALLLVVLAIFDPRDVGSARFKFVLAMILCGMFALNCTFLVASNLNTSCLRLAKRSWSMMAASVSSTDDMLGMPDIVKDFIAVRGMQDYFGQFDLQNQESHKQVDARAQGRCAAISSHTLMLWQRMMMDSEYLREKLTCRLYGVFKLEYAAVLRFNFWTISLAILLINMRG